MYLDIKGKIIGVLHQLFPSLVGLFFDAPGVGLCNHWFLLIWLCIGTKWFILSFGSFFVCLFAS